MKAIRSFFKGSRLFLCVFTIVFLLLATVCPNSFSSPIEFANGHWYESLGPSVCHTWIEARDYADSQTFEDPNTGVLLQGHLVTIQDQAENDFVHTNFVGGAWQQMWIGAFQFSHDGGLADNWAWVTGEKWNYTNWDSTEPGSFDEDYARLLNFFNGKWHDFPNVASNCGNLYTVIEYEPPIYSCSGFEPPIDKAVSVKKKNRVLPLKMVLFDQSGTEVTDLDAPPVVEVDFTGGTPTNPPGEEFLSAGHGDEGNEFVYTGNYWRFNLQTKNFSSSGIYTIKAVSSDPNEYTIAPMCEATFVIE